MITNERAVRTILRLKKEWYPRYQDKGPSRWILLEMRSYCRSAMDEIIFYIKDRPDQNPIDSIEEFRHLSDQMACESVSEIRSFMFSCFYDVATDIIDELCALNEEKIRRRSK